VSWTQYDTKTNQEYAGAPAVGIADCDATGSVHSFMVLRHTQISDTGISGPGGEKSSSGASDKEIRLNMHQTDA